MTTKLTLDDIADLRAYEREREAFRAEVIALKKRRRVHVGPFVTLVFENRDTVRFQIQEMARVERILTDAGIRAELDAYNPLIPGPGQLRATMFIELTTEADLRTWLPQLVGIERHVVVRVGDGPEAVDYRAEIEAAHASQLTREEITASVHYLEFEVGADTVEALAAGPVHLVLDHPAYHHETRLESETVAELVADVQGASTV